MPLVSNSGPILSFARADMLDLLYRVVGELVIPDAVYDDIVVQGAGKPGAYEVAGAFWIKRQAVQNRRFLKRLPSRLHLGEQEAIALALELRATLLIDESEARKEAKRLNVVYIGSLRILKQAKDRKLVSEAKPILDKLIRSGTYIGEELYKRFLRELVERT
jgi:predicted nucleic acid-binding protein